MLTTQHRIGVIGLWAAILGIVWCLTPCHLLAQTKDSDVLGVAPALEPWVGWVMHQRHDRGCAQLRPGEKRCVWPGVLRVKADEAGAQFELDVWVGADEAAVTLPGSNVLWPRDVQVKGKPLVVAKRFGSPATLLGQGFHTIKGRFVWRPLPGFLTVPVEIAQVELSVGNGVVKRPRLDEQGRLWLRDTPPANTTPTRAEDDVLRVQVTRRLRDEVPVRITNRFELNVSGQPRQVMLGQVLVKGSRPVLVRSDLPVQVSPEGKVGVYVKPGTHVVEIESTLKMPAVEVKGRAVGSGVLEEREVWVWQPNTLYRSARTSGLTAVDPDRTSIPDAWRTAGMTFLAEPGQTLSLETIRRGDVEPPPNTLRLERSMWLELGGDTWTSRDRLSGRMHRDWRLDYHAGNLARVTDRIDRRDLLITQHPKTQAQGIELRKAPMSLQAEVHFEGDSSLNIVGWKHDVQSLLVDVHLPPGWELVGGTGMDELQNTWADAWTLFDLLFLVVVVLALGRLRGWPWALVAAVALALGQGHPDAPKWVWIHLLVTLALLQYLPDGWFRRSVYLYRAGALVALLAILAPHINDLVLVALHPQVSRERTASFTETLGNLLPSDADGDDKWTENQPSAPEPAPFSQSSSDSDEENARGADFATNIPTVSTNGLRELDPNAIVQTGRGLPDWRWKQWTLRWQGPVGSDHAVNLWILSPFWNRWVHIARVLALVLMALVIVSKRDMTWRKRPEDEEPQPKPKGLWARMWWHLFGMAWIVVLPFTLPAPASAQEGGFPPEELLQELRQRIDARDACGGPCVVASWADLAISDQTLTLKAEVHALRDAAWFLPGTVDALHIAEVTVDGKATHQLRRESGGWIAVRLEPGHHRITMTGELTKNAVTLGLEDSSRPQHISFQSDGWRIDGLGEQGVPDKALQLTRLGTEPAPVAEEKEPTSTELPPWFRIERHLLLGLPWSMKTTVTRDNTAQAQLLKIPSLPGETVVTEGIRTKTNEVLLDFSQGQHQIVYSSQLPIADAMLLTAPTDVPWTETWTVECKAVWQCQFTGTPTLRSVLNDAYVPFFAPWPGENLRIAVARPAGIQGASATVDKATYEVTPGDRVLQARLLMVIRASQGGWHTIGLPKEAELRVVRINNREESIRPIEGAVTLPIGVGRQDIVLEWQQPWTRSLHEVLPIVDLGSSAVNAQVRFYPGEGRWPIWTTGPAWGPAILFWSRVLILLLIGLLLAGTLRHLPIKPWEWLVLVLGLTQVSYMVLLPIVAWFVLLAWRQRRPPESWWRFNIVQAGIVVLTLGVGALLYQAIATNLVGTLDFHVEGGGSNAQILGWYVDRIVGALPEAGVVSLPLWSWRLLMLVWAVWLGTRLWNWVPWGWQAFGHEGLYRQMPEGLFRRTKAETSNTDNEDT